MKNTFLVSLFVVSLYSFMLFVPIAFAASDCTLKSKPMGFSIVKKAELTKAFFYSEPKLCVDKSLCKTQRKAYLVSGNFVQVAQTEGAFACVMYRNFNGNGGKETFGWMQISDLEPVRSKLEKKDLIGSWVQAPCGDNEDCSLFIQENEKDKKQLDISVVNHLNSHEMEILTVKESKELAGKINFKASLSGVSENVNGSLIYDAKDIEPGTIVIKDADTVDGIYRR